MQASTIFIILLLGVCLREILCFRSPCRVASTKTSTRSLTVHAKRAKKTRAVTSKPQSDEAGASSGGYDGEAASSSLSSTPSSSTASGGQSAAVLDVNAFSSLSTRDSKLSPLKGTIDARIKEFESKSNIERAIAEYTAPTPAGTEPKLVKTMKQVTWIAVILLVLTEIVVSVKVGGAPFELGKVSLPSLPNFSVFTGGAGPQPTP